MYFNKNNKDNKKEEMFKVNQSSRGANHLITLQVKFYFHILINQNVFTVCLSAIVTQSFNALQPSPSPVAMYREPSLHDVAEQSPPRKTPKTSSDSPVLQNGKKDPQSKTKTSSS